MVAEAMGPEAEEGLSGFGLGSGIGVEVEEDVDTDASGVRRFRSRGSSSIVRVATPFEPSSVALLISTSSSDSPLNLLVQSSSERDLFLDPSWCW